MEQQNLFLRKGKPRHRGSGWIGESQRHSEAARKGHLRKFAKKKIANFAADTILSASPVGAPYATFKAVGYGLEKAKKFSGLQKKIGAGKAVVAVTSDLVKDDLIGEVKERTETNFRDSLGALRSKKKKNNF